MKLKTIIVTVTMPENEVGSVKKEIYDFFNDVGNNVVYHVIVENASDMHVTNFQEAFPGTVTHNVQCVVACVDANGASAFYPHVVEITQGEYDDGDHYAIAKDAAEAAGYEKPMLVYDQNDGPEWLFKQFWPDGPIQKISETPATE